MTKKIRMTLLSVLVCLMVSTAAIGLMGCNNTANDQDEQPKSAYTLSFDANGGSSVDAITIEDGKAITLPTTEKANHAFCGWYFDNNTFSDAANGTTLKYLSAKTDLTVYAKWEEIDLNKDGVYGVDFALTVSDTVILDAAPEGFSPTFENNFSEKESGISIIDGKKYLDLVVYGSEEFGFFQGGMKYAVKYNGVALSIYTGAARVNSMDMANAEGRRQFRLPIDNNTDAVTLSVQEYMPNEEVIAMPTSCATYNVAVSFRDVTYKAHAAKSENLEDGIYTVESHALSAANGSVSMNESFNDVRAYIAVENGNMTMFKTFRSYMGMTGKEGKAAYFDGLATYMGYTFVTPVSDVWKSDGKFNTDYSKKDLVAVETWFDSQSGMFTYSWEVDEWTDSYIVTGTVTGFMLEMMGMASSETLLYIDKATMIKTDDVVLPVKPAGAETKWTTKASGNVVSALDELDESWHINFIWQGGLDIDIAERNLLSFTSKAVPRIDEESGEVYADVEYTVYNVDATQELIGDAVRVAFRLGNGNSYNTGGRQNVLITSEKPENKQVSIQLSQVDWLLGKEFDADNEMEVTWKVGESYIVPEAAITVDGFEYSLLKGDSSGSGAPVPGAGYKIYGSVDRTVWVDASGNGFSGGAISALTGGSVYKYYRIEMGLKDQYGENICYTIYATVQELNIEWGLAQDDNSGVDIDDYGTLIRANAGDTVNVPKYTFKVDDRQQSVTVRLRIFTATSVSTVSQYVLGTPIDVSDEAVLIELRYIGTYTVSGCNQYKYVYIAVRGKMDIEDITAAESVNSGDKAYFIAPTVKIFGKQVAAKVTCKSFDHNGLATSFDTTTHAVQTDSSGRSYAVAKDSALYLCLNITCGKIAGDGSALGYSWNVTLNGITRIIVNQPAAN